MDLNFLRKTPKKKKAIRSARSKLAIKNRILIVSAILFSGLCLFSLNAISLSASLIALIYMAVCGFIFYEMSLERKEEQDENIGFSNALHNIDSAPPVPQNWHAPVSKEQDGQQARPLTQDNNEPAKITNKTANDDEQFDGSNLTDMVVTELLHHAVRNQRVDIFVQPIVRLPQRQARFFEIYARIRVKPGAYLPASRYMDLAKQDKLINDIDTILLAHCLQTIQKTAHIDDAQPFFLNITPATLKDTLFMSNLLKFLATERSMAPRLIFEIKQKDFMNLPPSVMQILQGIARLGCRFSLDHVTDVDFDVQFLQKNNIQFIKLDADWMLGEMETDRTYTDMMRLKRKMESNGIGVIAEKLEDESALRELLDYDLHYAQGYLFGRPVLQSEYAKKKAA